MTWLLRASQECPLSSSLLNQTSIPSHKKKPNYQDPSAGFLFWQSSAVNHDISPPFYSTKSLTKTKQSRNDRKQGFFNQRYIKETASRDVLPKQLKINNKSTVSEPACNCNFPTGRFPLKKTQNYIKQAIFFVKLDVRLHYERSHSSTCAVFESHPISVVRGACFQLEG